MNFRRAAIAAGASVAALLLMSGALYIDVLVTLDFDFPGSALRLNERLLVTILPSTAACVGSGLLTRALASGWRRAWIPAAVAFVAAFVLLSGQLGPTTISSSRGTSPASTAFALLLVSALSTLVSTIRRVDISPRSRRNVLILLAVTAVSWVLTLMLTTAGVSLIVALAIWVLLPALVGLMLPRSPSSTRTSRGESA